MAAVAHGGGGGGGVVQATSSETVFHLLASSKNYRERGLLICIMI